MGSLEKVLHLPRLMSLLFFGGFFRVLHSFVLRLPFILERLGIVFSIPRQLERVTSCLAIGPVGEKKQMVQFPCHPVCLAVMSGSKWKRIYSHTMKIYCIYMHIQMHSRLGSSKLLVTHINAGSFNTDFFHLLWRPSLDAPVQKHLIWVQKENKLQSRPPK